MQFIKVDFKEMKIGDYIWRNIPDIESNRILRPNIVGENEILIVSDGIDIPISLFGDKIIWYKPIIQSV